MGVTATEISTRDVSVARSPRGLSVVCAVLVSVLIFLFHFPFAQNPYLGSDSADYMRAARAPFVRTYLNINSATPLEIFRRMRNDPEFRSRPWDTLYFQHDNAAFRHFHVPFSFYPMHAVSVVGSTDRNQRWLASVVTAITCGVIVVGLYAFNVPVTVAVATGLVAGIQSRYTEVSISPSPHGWYMLFAVLFLFSFAFYLRDHRFKILVLSSIFLAFAFATLEFSLELVASLPLALIICWFVNRRSLGNVKEIAISIAKVIPIFCLVTFILWPGGWIRGGYLECYGVLAGAVLFKNNTFIGDRLTLPGLYGRFFYGHEALLVVSLLMVLAVVWLVQRRKISAVTVLFVSYTAVACVFGVADHFQHDTYISETVLFLLVSAGLLIGDMLANVTVERRKMAMTAAVVLLAVVGAQEWSRRQPASIYRPWLGPVLAGVSAKVPAGATILVNDNLELYSTYLSQYHIEPTVSPTDLHPRNSKRAGNVHYLLLSGNASGESGSQMLETFSSNVSNAGVRLYEWNP